MGYYRSQVSREKVRDIGGQVVLCLVHAAMSALLLATNNVAFHALRDVLADTGTPPPPGTWYV